MAYVKNLLIVKRVPAPIYATGMHRFPMPIKVTHGTSRCPGASEKLTRIVYRLSHLEGQLYIGFPFLPSSEKPQPIDAILVFGDGNIVVFDLVDGKDSESWAQRQDVAYNLLE